MNVRSKGGALTGALFLFLFGCDSTSILSDTPQPYAWLPAHTSYQDLLAESRGQKLWFVLADGQVYGGTLVRADRDTIVFIRTNDSALCRLPAHQAARIEHSSRTVPIVVATTVSCLFFAAVGRLMGSASGGMRGPEIPPASQVIACGAAGAVLGYFIGETDSVTHTFLVTSLSLQPPALPDTGTYPAHVPVNNKR